MLHKPLGNRPLPDSAFELVDQLDEHIPKATVTTAVVPADCSRLSFDAGRRSIVDELMRRKDNDPEE